jgi:Fe-S-cluster containining protein
MDTTFRLHILADKLLPEMRCDKGCDFCCTVAAASPSEYDRVLAYAKAHGLKPRKQGVLCPWYQGGRCAVHPVRPLVCRVFGHAPDLVCPRGYNTNAPRPALTRLRRLHRQTRPTPDQLVYLHDVCYTRPQIEVLLQHLEDEERKAAPV